MMRKIFGLIMVLALAALPVATAAAQGDPADYTCSVVEIEGAIIQEYLEIVAGAGYVRDHVEIVLPRRTVNLGDTITVYAYVHIEGGRQLIQTFEHRIDNCQNSPAETLDWTCQVSVTQEQFGLTLAEFFTTEMEYQYSQWIKQFGPIRQTHTEESWRMRFYWERISAVGTTEETVVNCHFESGWNWIEIEETPQGHQWSMGEGHWFDVGLEATNLMGLQSGQGGHLDLRFEPTLGLTFEVRDAAGVKVTYEVTQKLTEAVWLAEPVS
jgi:hypothetical protein